MIRRVGTLQYIPIHPGSETYNQRIPPTAASGPGCPVSSDWGGLTFGVMSKVKRSLGERLGSGISNSGSTDVSLNYVFVRLLN